MTTEIVADDLDAPVQVWAP